MPTYDYRCTKCGHTFELYHSIKDDAPKKCPKCKGKCVRIPSGGAGLLFKGSGFYITDYRSSAYEKKAKEEKSGGGSSGGGSSGGGSESSSPPSTPSPSAPSSPSSKSSDSKTPKRKKKGDGQ